MKQDRVQQAASVVRAPNWIVVDIIRFPLRSYIKVCEDRAREHIRQSFEEDPSLLRPDREVRFPVWLRRLSHGEPAPVRDELHAGSTMAAPLASDFTEVDVDLARMIDPNATKPIPALI